MQTVTCLQVAKGIDAGHQHFCSFLHQSSPALCSKKPKATSHVEAMVYYPFNMVFVNARMRTLTHRVLCLSATAAGLVVVKFVVFFLSDWNVLKEFHEEQLAAEDKTSILEGPFGKLIVGTFALVLALIVPCCGFLGAKSNNRPCICCFACCNCWGGCLSILQMIVIILVMVGLGSVETLCQSPDSCPGLMKGCKNHKSQLYNLATYEGCLDYMVSMFPSVYAGLGVALGQLSCDLPSMCVSSMGKGAI